MPVSNPPKARRARNPRPFAGPGGLAQTARMGILLPLLLLALAGAAALLALRVRRGSRRRQQAISQLLDAADALESRLRAAMQELLRQRLWLQDNAERASLEQLHGVRDALDAARASIERQLQRVDRARAGAV